MIAPDSRLLILAASDRLARALREDLHLAERSAGHSVWRTPDVRSLRQWLNDVWADTWPPAQLLDATQMQALWLDAVERDRHGVISATACAREAREAERLTQDYALDLDDDPAYSEEQRAWRRWRQFVAKRMREQNWLSAEQLPKIVAKALDEGRIIAPAQVRLAGFDATATAATRAVLDALRRVTEVTDQVIGLPFARHATEPATRAWRCVDDEAQMRLVAEQVRIRLAAVAEDDTLPRIVIALPEADARRAALEAALIEQVAPGLRQPSGDGISARAPWRWDSAAPLSAAPFAAGLLGVIAFDAFNNPPVSASQLLLNTWSVDERLHAAAATVDLALREAGTLRISARRLAELAKPPLHAMLERLAAIIEAAPRHALPSVWSAHFSERLEAVGWPGVTALSSASFQSVQELRRSLSALGALDAQTGPIDAGRARLWLGEACKRRFEPRAEHTQPVRILDAADAIGVACDLLIVVDADASAFPGSARPTPFLPIERQRAAGVPQATPATWLAHRRAEIDALIAPAREVLLIAPRIDARGGEVTPSPLFAATWTDAPEPCVLTLAEHLAAAGPQARLPDQDRVPPVADQEQLRGTTRLFEQFAVAPFFAFCTQRLGIEPLPEVAHGLPAQLQGKLIHEALAKFWEAVGSSTALRAMDAAERRKRIVAGLAPLLRRDLPTADYGRMLVQLEAARLADVIGAWLAFECARDEDFRVLAHERRLESEVGGLPVSLRIDRIEQSPMAPGAPLRLIDYKTGAKIDASGWREDALTAPQLPLYAVLFEDAEGAVADIAFAHVADGMPSLLSWQTGSSGKRKVLPHAGDFAAQRLAWRAALETVAREFLAGRADIDPGRAAIRDNALLPLAGLLDEADDADDGDAAA